MTVAAAPRYVLCLDDGGYPASLVRRKVYRVVPDAGAEARQLTRVVDESGEDYLFPAELFVPIDVPAEAVDALARAS